jgi:hypothetical protein
MSRSVGRLTSALVLSLLAFGLLAPTAAAAATRFVDDDGHAGAAGCDAARKAPEDIQTAVDASGAGDLILVCPGTYRGLITVSGAARNGLTIRSIRPGRAVIKPPSSPADTVLVTIDGSERVTVRSFRLVFPTGGPCHHFDTAIYVAPGADDAKVIDDRIRSIGGDTLGDTNGCGYSEGVKTKGAPGASIVGNSILDFQSEGISVRGPGGGTKVKDNVVSYRHPGESGSSTSTYGIEVSVGAGAVVRGNRLVGLASAKSGSGTPLLYIGVYGAGAGNGLVIRENLVRYQDYGIEVDSEDAGLRIIGNGVRASRTTGMYLFDDGGGVVRDNSVKGSAVNAIEALVGTSAMSIHDNDFRGPSDPDCADDSGGGAAGPPHYGTQNSWRSNRGTGDPAGICKP